CRDPSCSSWRAAREREEPGRDPERRRDRQVDVAIAVGVAGLPLRERGDAGRDGMRKKKARELVPRLQERPPEPDGEAQAENQTEPAPAGQVGPRRRLGHEPRRGERVGHRPEEREDGLLIPDLRQDVVVSRPDEVGRVAARTGQKEWRGDERERAREGGGSKNAREGGLVVARAHRRPEDERRSGDPRDEVRVRAEPAREARRGGEREAAPAPRVNEQEGRDVRERNHDDRDGPAPAGDDQVPPQPREDEGRERPATPGKERPAEQGSSEDRQRSGERGGEPDPGERGAPEPERPAGKLEVQDPDGRERLPDSVGCGAQRAEEVPEGAVELERRGDQRQVVEERRGGPPGEIREPQSRPRRRPPPRAPRSTPRARRRATRAQAGRGSPARRSSRRSRGSRIPRSPRR